MVQFHHWPAAVNLCKGGFRNCFAISKSRNTCLDYEDRGLSKMASKKQKKGKNSKEIKQKDLALEEHIVKLLERQNKKEIKQSIDAVVRKEKPKKAESKPKKEQKIKERIRDIYAKGLRDEYRSLHGAGVYDQIKFSPFVGLLYKSNIKENNEFYQHLEYGAVLEKHHASLAGERNLVSSEGMDDYGRNTMLNFLIGSPTMTSGMCAVSFEEMEVMKFNLYDKTQNVLYIAKLKIMGFGDQMTVLKTMHAPMDESKAA